MLHRARRALVRQIWSFWVTIMKRHINIAAFTLGLVALLLTSAGSAAAQRRNERDIRDSLRSLSSRIDDFEYDLRSQMTSNSVDRGLIANVSDDISRLKDEIRQFQNNFDRKRENREDANAIVDAARRIEEFMRTYPQNRRVTDDWSGVRTQIDRLAANYGVTTDWNEEPLQPVADSTYGPNYPRPTVTVTVGLSGTYDLDLQKSEDIDDIVAGSGVSGTDRDELKDKLAAPGQIALDIRGTQVTLATSTATPVSFNADGSEKVETDASGRTIRLKASLQNDTLVISSLGGDTDYTITFTSTRNGQEMKVSRRITTNYLRQTVFAESVYNKTDAVARLGIDNSVNNNSGGYSDNDGSSTQPANGQYGNGAPAPTLPRTGNFVVPNGMAITAILDTPINTKASQNNDRFRMTVQSPNEFRGATIDGYVSGVGRSGKVTGRSNVTFNFERITLRDGRIFDFAGNLQSVRDASGKEVKVDAEGAAKGGSQTKESVKRGGIGAGIGAIIGAIAGGAKGAAIGAIIGGGAGAGSVAIQGRDDLDLAKGSTVTVVSSSPIRGTTKVN